MERLLVLIIGILLMATGAMAQDIADGDSTGTKVIDGKQLSEVTVSARQSGRVKTSGLGNTEFISSKELLRAACCTLARASPPTLPST